MESKHQYKTATLAALAVIFVAATSLLSFTNRAAGDLRVARFDWPDEMATAFFVERIVDGLPIAAYDPLIAQAANRIHPRSINVRNSTLVPGGFLGFPILLGIIGTWFGYAATFFVTPLLAAAGVFALVSIVRRVFDERIAWLTGILAFTNPALLYYTSYVMLPNVAFVSLALCGAALARTARWRFAGGLLVGLALFIRPNEMIWVLPVFFVVTRQTIPLLGLMLGFAPTLLANTAVFGHPLATGYNRFVEATSSAASPLEFSGNFFLPFGIRPALIAANLWHSALKLFWWLTIPAAVGLILWWRSRPTTIQKRFTLIVLIMSLWLVIYYGSWPFTDLEILNLNTIGRSYVRYWLPMFLLMLPFVAIVIRRLGRYAGTAVLVVMALLSVRLAYWSAPESILPVADRIFFYHLARYDVTNDVPRDSIIITWRTDKVIFPERRVVETDLSAGLDAELASVVQNSNLEWFVLAALTDEQRHKIENSLSDRRLVFASGRWGMNLKLYKIKRL